MRCQSLVLVLAALGTVAAVLPARAHHSYANYDMSTLVDLEGTVKQVYWLFPHVAIYVEVEDEQGQVQIWAMGPPLRPGLKRPASAETTYSRAIGSECSAIRSKTARRPVRWVS